LKDAIPPDLPAAQVLIQPHRMAEGFDIVSQAPGNGLTLSVVADEDFHRRSERAAV
jgi:hypothetical protein